MPVRPVGLGLTENFPLPEQDVFVQGWYSDPEAWNARLAWIRGEGLGGIGVWVLDGAHDPPERWEALRAYLRAAKEVGVRGRGSG